MAKVLPIKSKVIPESSQLDSVKAAKLKGDRRNLDILFQAMLYWNNLGEFRKERKRCKLYYFGKPWSDVIKVDNKWMTEEEYILSQGNVPLQNNLIRRLGRNVIGVYRDQSKEPSCTARDRDEQRYGETMSTLLQYVWQLNRIQEINPRSFEEYLIGGLICHKKTYGWDRGRCDCWTKWVNSNRFFFDTDTEDVRGWDVNMVGEIHDVTFQKLVTQFCKSPKDYEKLRQCYAYAANREFLYGTFENFSHRRLENIDFMMPDDPSKCRVIEVWNKESQPRYHCHDWLTGELFVCAEDEKAEQIDNVNAERIRMYNEQGVTNAEDMALIDYEWSMDEYWYYRYLTPTGIVLDEGETPYSHGEHPYVFKAYPFIDAEIHSFVSDLLDQQRYVNRLITMYDWIMRASAKGVLMFPEDALPDGYNMEEIAEEWSKFNGMIVYKAKAGVPAPHQIANNCTQIGIQELLNLQLKFFEDISGVQGALQGKPGYSSTSGALYAQQTQNSTKSLMDLLDSFSDFVRECAYKDVKNIQQFYDEKRVLNICGKRGVKLEADAGRVLDVEMDVSIIESTSTPAYRDMANQFLIEIWKTGQIGLEQLLENGDFPFADDLLQSIRSNAEQIQQGQVPQGVANNLMQQAQQGANMDAVNQLYGAMRGAA